MLIQPQNYTTKYNNMYCTNVRQLSVSSFKGADKFAETRKVILGQLTKIEKSKNSKPLISGLSFVGLAALLNKFNVIKNSEFISNLRKEIKDAEDNNETLQDTKESVSEEQQNTISVGTTELKTVTDTNTESVAQEPTMSKEEALRELTSFIECSPDRKKCIAIIKNYKNLSQKYNDLLMRYVLDSNNEALEKEIQGFEETIKLIPKLAKGYAGAKGNVKNKRLNTEIFMENLNSVYIDYFDDICRLFEKENRVGRQLNIMHRIAQDDFIPERIPEYLKYSHLSYYEFDLIKQYKLEHLLTTFNELKKQHKIKFFRLSSGKNFDDPVGFALQFKQGNTTQERIEATIKFFEALHNHEVTLTTDKSEKKEFYTMRDLYHELYTRLEKDKALTALYNFAKFVNPEALKDYNYTSDYINNLTPLNGQIASEEYQNLKRQIAYAIVYLDNNEKCKELLNVINDKNVFSNCNYMANFHSVLRFICRFVLNDNYNEGFNLREECINKNRDLEKAFSMTMENSTLVLAYRYNGRKGFAPCFYLHEENPLGPYVRVTLNKAGQVHTLFYNMYKSLSADDVVEDDE